MNDQTIKNEGYGIKGKPTSNAVSKEEFQTRVEEVFSDLRNILAKSFGAYGAPTFISNLASTTVTKDGFTIMKNLVYDTEKGDPVDHIIYNMASDICARLNYKVGDGTTTAIIAATSIYEKYMADDVHSLIRNMNLMPRDVIQAMKEVQEEIVEKIKEKAVPINNTDDMVDKIRKIVKISSNNNEEITDMITKVYEETGSPYINCKLSKDGRTKMNIIEGFQAPISLGDKIFVNSDEMKAIEKDIDVILFDHKVTAEVYTNIIKPLNNICAQCGRKLLIVAPNYDEVGFNTVIKRDLLTEYNKRGTNNSIFTSVALTTSTQIKSYSDLAMLLNTVVIDMNKENELLDKIEKDNVEVWKLLDISNRHIAGINIAAYANKDDEEENQLSMMQDDGLKEYNTGISDDAIRVGFAEHFECGFGTAVFRGFHYNKHMYEAMFKDAEDDLKEKIERYSKLGNFSYEIMRAQRRYNSLNLKVAEIEVGGDSQLSQRMLKDTVDDAILAAESAYTHGYVLGCNVTTLRVIRELVDKYSAAEASATDKMNSNTIKILVLYIIGAGFESVYKQVLANAYNEYLAINIKPEDIQSNNWKDKLYERVAEALNVLFGHEIITKIWLTPDELVETISYMGTDFDSLRQTAPETSDDGSDTIYQINLLDLIVNISIMKDAVFDLEAKEFSSDIINSANTDIQVLIASMDLITLLINGNQLVITSKHNFQQS